VIAKNRGRVLLVAAMVLVAPALGWGSGFALFEVGGRQAGMAGTDPDLAQANDIWFVALPR
jgi:hypothetical protein